VLSPAQLTQWTRQALDAARRGDEVLAAMTAGWVADRGDVLDLVAACRVVADLALRALLVLYAPPAHGEVWVLHELGNAVGHPERVFAARLVTAYANQDQELVTALVAAAAGASPTERADSLRALVTNAVGLDAQAVHHQQPPEERSEADE